MKFNNKKITIQEHNVTEIEREKILHSEKEKKLIILNESATLIYEFLKKASEDDLELNWDEMMTFIKDSYEISDEQMNQLEQDVETIIDDLIYNGFAIVKYT